MHLLTQSLQQLCGVAPSQTDEDARPNVGMTHQRSQLGRQSWVGAQAVGFGHALSLCVWIPKNHLTPTSGAFWTSSAILRPLPD